MGIYLNVCICTICVPVAFEEQMRGLQLLKLELQIIVPYHVGAENKAKVLSESGNFCSPYSVPPSLSPSIPLPPFYFFLVGLTV